MRKLLALVQRLDWRNVDRESPIREKCMRTHKILKKNQNRVIYESKNSIGSSRNQKHRRTGIHEYETTMKLQDKNNCKGFRTLLEGYSSQEEEKWRRSRKYD